MRRRLRLIDRGPLNVSSTGVTAGLLSSSCYRVLTFASMLRKEVRTVLLDANGMCRLPRQANGKQQPCAPTTGCGSRGTQDRQYGFPLL